GEAIDARTRFRDGAHDLVAEHEGQLGVRQLAIGNVEIGAAHPARPHLNEELARSRLRRLHERLAQRATGCLEQHGAHSAHSHSMLPGGFELTSLFTRFTTRTSLMISL